MRNPLRSPKHICVDLKFCIIMVIKFVLLWWDVRLTAEADPSDPPRGDVVFYDPILQ